MVVVILGQTLSLHIDYSITFLFLHTLYCILCILCMVYYMVISEHNYCTY